MACGHKVHLKGDTMPIKELTFTPALLGGAFELRDLTAMISQGQMVLFAGGLI